MIEITTEGYDPAEAWTQAGRDAQARYEGVPLAHPTAQLAISLSRVVMFPAEWGYEKDRYVWFFQIHTDDSFRPDRE